MKYATCHPDRKSEGKGLCKSCYIKDYYQANKKRLSIASKKRYKEGGKEKWKPYYIQNQAKILARQKEYREKNKAEINRKQNLNWSRYKYGISLEQVNEVLAKQDNRCYGCLRPFTETLYSCVDHCHKTNKFRGMLCDPCNKSLGILLDNPETLRRLADYLEKNL